MGQGISHTWVQFSSVQSVLLDMAFGVISLIQQQHLKKYQQDTEISIYIQNGMTLLTETKKVKMSFNSLIELPNIHIGLKSSKVILKVDITEYVRFG